MLLLSLSAAAETADQIVGKVLGALNAGSVTAMMDYLRYMVGDAGLVLFFLLVIFVWMLPW